MQVNIFYVFLHKQITDTHVMTKRMNPFKQRRNPITGDLECYNDYFPERRRKRFAKRPKQQQPDADKK